MEKATDLETKYQKLATEYSKIRSHATVLKKAVLDEQSKILELKDVVKEQEQKIRKHDQEMDSLTFRNEQLTKRIGVLQQELQINSHGKRSKHKTNENQVHTNLSVLDEELHKKIVENAELVSTMADKEIEIANYKERISWLEDRVDMLHKENNEMKDKHKQDLYKLRQTIKMEEFENSPAKSKVYNKECDDCKNKQELEKELKHWQREVERWRTECDLLRSKPESNEQVTEYYESQIRSIFEKKQLALSQVSSLQAENDALTSRLEDLCLGKSTVETELEMNKEELQSTNDNYKLQLDAMTEHFAAQNEKITKQCDEIQLLKHKLSMKK